MSFKAIKLEIERNLSGDEESDETSDGGNTEGNSVGGSSASVCWWGISLSGIWSWVDWGSSVNWWHIDIGGAWWAVCGGGDSWWHIDWGGGNIDWGSSWAVSGGDGGSIAVVGTRADSGVVCVGVGLGVSWVWSWGLVDWWGILGGVGWWNVVWNLGGWCVVWNISGLWDILSSAGGDAVCSAGVGLGWARGHIVSARGDSDVLVAGIGDLIWGSSRAGWSIVDWGLSGLVGWLLSAGGD